MARSDSLGPVGGSVLPLKPSDVNFIAVHCSATGQDMNVAAADIDRWHRAKGWAGIGYHFVIRRDGTLEPGRPLGLRGAHVEGHNHEAVGVCLVGGSDGSPAGRPQANFTVPQMATLKTLLAQLHSQFPRAVTQGHRDFPNVSKACPSFNVKHWLETSTLTP
jgi:N-acetylmuramoyl-L-alanine amidase